MTTTDRAIKRETRETFRGKPLVIEIHPTWLSIRLKGQRARYTVYSQMFTLGAHNAAEERRRERLEARKARRAGAR